MLIHQEVFTYTKIYTGTQQQLLKENAIIYDPSVWLKITPFYYLHSSLDKKKKKTDITNLLTKQRQLINSVCRHFCSIKIFVSSTPSSVKCQVVKKNSSGGVRFDANWKVNRFDR